METLAQIFKNTTSPVGYIYLNLYSSVSWRLVLSGVLLVVGERRLLVALGATAAGVWGGWVWSNIVVGWVSVLLVKVTHSFAIPSICKKCQKTLLIEI